MKNYLNLIAFSHTIFALPFALIGFTFGLYNTENTFSLKLLILVVLCMVFARSAAMAFNRYIDRNIDAKNTRTAIREIPSGKVSEKMALSFVILNSIAFVICTYFINDLCFYLSPIALLIILGYSITKRFTFLCHLILGLGLALAPVGAYIAVTSTFDLVPILFGFAVLFWVSGFDIIYALQDQKFDKSLSLNSIPVRFGTKKSLLISNSLHLICALLMILATYLTGEKMGALFYTHYLGLLIFIGFLIYQHSLVSFDDFSKIDRAFFTSNGIASIVFGSFFILGLILNF